MAKESGLASVTYSRTFQVEQSLPAMLVGSSAWAKDLELLLEDTWPKLTLSDLGSDIAGSVSRTSPKVVLIEAIADFNQIKHVLEAILPADTKKVILLKETENQFVIKTYLNYAARSGVTAIELPIDPKLAAVELSEILGALLGKVRGEIDEDIARAELLVDGFVANAEVVSIAHLNWNDRSETVLSWLFPLVKIDTAEFRLLRVLVRARPMFSRQNQWTATVRDTLIPLQSYAQNTGAQKYIDLVILMAETLPHSGTPSMHVLEETIDGSALGMLTKRSLRKELQKLADGFVESHGQKKVG